jgi:septal ring factor EnvC (AmiA/AmiB activator)
MIRASLRIAAVLLALLLPLPLSGCGNEASGSEVARIAALEGQVVSLEKMQQQQDSSNAMLLEYIKAQQATNTEFAAMLRRHGGNLDVHEASLDSIQKELAALRLSIEALVKGDGGK